MRFERLENTLNDLRTRIKGKWSKLTKADLDKIEGHYSELADVIAKRYSMSKGEAKEAVEEFGDEVGTTFGEVAQHLGDAASDAWRNGRHAVKEAFDRTAERAGDAWQSTNDGAQHLRERTGEVVKQKPLTSILVAAGVGIFAGFLLRRSR
jgi:ElaB/YqjD/DUF883 family membrane-anchored ribosome-binding protein